MDPVKNPYAPGAGVPPPHLVGRKERLESFRILLARLEIGRPERGVMLTGLRGVGKTVLLGACHKQAVEGGWIVAFVESELSGAFRLQLARALGDSLRSLSRRRRTGDRLRQALAVFKSFSLRASPDGSLTLGIDVDPHYGRADTGNMELDLTDLLTSIGEAASGIKKGVIVLIDEVQELPKQDLAALARASHRCNQRGLPVALVGAGLPSVPVLFNKAKTYAERLFAYPRVGRLVDEDAAEALALPAERLNVTWERDALARAVSASAGYPYFLQSFGRSIWNNAVGSDTITTEDAEIGMAVARDVLDREFYGARWLRATPGQRTYLEAMAEIARYGEAPVSSGEVANRLGKTHSELSPYRRQLIDRGLIYDPSRGQVAFTVPGMAGYIRRNAG